MVSYSFADPSGKGVEEALKLTSLSPQIKAFLLTKQEEWENFGKKNSHLYRKMLFDLYKRLSLSPEAIMMVHAFTAVIKSQPRIVMAMENMSEEDQKLSWHYPVLNFFRTETTQYVSVANRTKKYPVVNIPTAMPGLDILLACLTTRKDMRTMDWVARRPTFSQLKLDVETQTLAKKGYEEYWTKIVRGTKNKDDVEKPGMKEEYYQNSAGDEYLLFELNRDGNIIVLRPENLSRGYTKEEIKRYIGKDW